MSELELSDYQNNKSIEGVKNFRYDFSMDLTHKIESAKKRLDVGSEPVEVILNYPPEWSQDGLPLSFNLIRSTPAEGWKKTITGSVSTTIVI